MSGTTGRLYGVGVGPGDPELITLKAGVAGRSIARTIADDLVSEHAIEELLIYPVTTGTTDHPLGYDGAVADFYDESAERLGKHLDAGRSVVVLAEGDPLFYSSYMYLHDRLADRYRCEIVPGVTSISGAATAMATPLARHDDVLTVLPGTLPEGELVRRLCDTDAVAVMKLGRTFAAVRSALQRAGRLDEAWYIERATTGRERVVPVAGVDPATVPYFSMIVVPGQNRRSPIAADLRPEPVPAGGAPEVLVVGLGPGPDRWTTPEVAEALAGVRHVIGYTPYVNRVPVRAGQHRHASGNTVELERARLALDLALAGDRVAVVSGGDAGVFGMAAAVYEAAEDLRYAGVRVTVLPGVTAAQAVAARAGAPLGGDYAVLSLSDRLKPWALVERRLRAVAEADLVVAIYNPASKSRRAQIAAARDILLAARPATTPAVVGRDVGREGESLLVTTLGALDPETIDMRCLLIVGSSRTTVGPSGVWTSRSYRTGDSGRS